MESGERGIYLLMILLEVSQLLAQSLQLDLQVGPAQSQLVQDPTQTADVCVHALVKGLLILKPQKIFGSLITLVTPLFRPL